MARIKSISLNKEQDDFLNDNPELKLSAICQVAVNNLMENHRSISSEHLKLKNYCKHIEEEMQLLQNFVVDRNLMFELEKYEKECGLKK